MKFRLFWISAIVFILLLISLPVLGEGASPVTLPAPDKEWQGFYTILIAAGSAIATILGILFQNRNSTMQLQFAQISEQQKQIEQTRKEITQSLQEQIEDYRSDLESSRKSEQDLRVQAGILEGEIKRIESSNRLLLEENLKLKSEIQDLKVRIATLGGNS